MTDEQRMIEAIRVINIATIHVGRGPSVDAPASLLETYDLEVLDLAKRAGPRGIALRYFQRAGISICDVADAIEAGVLRVEIRGEQPERDDR